MAYISVSDKTAKAVNTVKRTMLLGCEIRETIKEIYGAEMADTIFENKWTCFDELLDKVKELVFESVNDNLLKEGGEI